MQNLTNGMKTNFNVFRLFMLLVIILSAFKHKHKHRQEDIITQLKEFERARLTTADYEKTCFQGACVASQVEMDAENIYDEILRHAEHIYTIAEQLYDDGNTKPRLRDVSSAKALNDLGAGLLIRSLPSIRESLLLEVVQVNGRFGGFCKSLTTFTVDPAFDKMDLWYPLSKYGGLLINGTSLQQEKRVIAIGKRDLGSRNSIFQPLCGIDASAQRDLLPPLDRTSFNIASRDVEARKHHKSQVMAANEVLADISIESIVGVIIIPSKVSYEEVLLLKKADSILTHYFKKPQKLGSIFAFVDNRLFSINNKEDYDYARKQTGGRRKPKPKT